MLCTLFAVISTVANIGAQDLLLRVAAPVDHAIALSVLFGTGVGLVVKYVLDNRYIFRYQTRGMAHDGRTFLLYALMGVSTTVIFWGFEFGFQALFEPLALPARLIDALQELERISSFEGRRRQGQFVGKLMRQLDDARIDAIREALESAE